MNFASVRVCDIHTPAEWEELRQELIAEALAEVEEILGRPTYRGLMLCIERLNFPDAAGSQSGWCVTADWGAVDAT